MLCDAVKYQHARVSFEAELTEHAPPQVSVHTRAVGFVNLHRGYFTGYYGLGLYNLCCEGRSLGSPAFAPLRRRLWVAAAAAAVVVLVDVVWSSPRGMPCTCDTSRRCP